jgi:hypothetical protein
VSAGPAAGPKLVATQGSIKGKGQSHAVRIATEDRRGKDIREHGRLIAANKKHGKAMNSKHHIAAAQEGGHAVEVDLFREFDVDGSGSLTGKVRPARRLAARAVALARGGGCLPRRS